MKLRDQKLKTIYLYIHTYTLLFIIHIVKTNWKSVITHTHKEGNPNTAIKIIIKSQEKKRKGETNNEVQNNPKQLT